MQGKEVKKPAQQMCPGKVKVLAAICAVGLSHQVWAQASSGQANEKSLNTVVVTATGFEQEIKDAPASISVVTREDIENKAYTNIDDALSGIPGVILTGGGNKKDISIRGMSASYTLILVDGKRQSSRETRPNSDGPGVESNWTPPLSAIERIEVIRGPMSSLYGSDAMGGVINIITRKVPTQWAGEIRTEGTVQQHDHSGKAYQHNFYLGGPIKNDLLGLQIYGKYGKRMEDQILNGYRGTENTDVTAKLALTPNKDHDIQLEVSRDRQKNQTSPGKTLASKTASADQDYREDKTSLSHTGRWGWATSQSYIQLEDSKNLTRDMAFKQWDVQSSWIVPLASHVITAGASYNNQTLHDKEPEMTGRGSRLDLERYQWALFAEDEWRIVDPFALTGGLRYDKSETFGSHLSPRLYGVWHVNNAWTVKGGVSTGFKVPNIRYVSTGMVQQSKGGNIYGNPDLKPEKSISEELALLYNNDEFSGSATLFNNQFKDKLNRIRCTTAACASDISISGRPATMNVNVDDAITRGMELGGKWILREGISLNASYTYTKSEQKSGQYKGKPLNQLPKHMISLGADWRVNDKVNTWAKVTYRGEESQPTTTPSASTNVAPSYTFVDLGGSYKLNKTATIYAGIYNLFDKQVNYDEYAYVEDGRRFTVGMTIGF